MSVLDPEPRALPLSSSLVDARMVHRAAACARFFDTHAESVARLCEQMARRFERGGRLVAIGASPTARSDVRHVAVEFVHPVIVGKRALPAIGLTPDGGSLPTRTALLVRPGDIVLAFAADGAADVVESLRVARRCGALTIADAPAGAEWEFVPESGDPFVDQELIETLYHVLWELVHVFFEHRGLLGDAAPDASRPDVGASQFLYPFLAGGSADQDADAVLADVARSARMKGAEVTALRMRTLHDGTAALHAAARALRRAFDAGGSLLALGNGGSATDAMDVVADFRAPPEPLPPRPALDLAEDSAILTALANDIGPDELFARQVIAYGRRGDVLLAFSTSGSSRNVVRALEEARRRGLETIAFVGYDGGRVAGEGLADHVIVTPSEYVPRIQEAQASAYHILRELVEQRETGPA